MRILILDDHGIIREGLKSLLQNQPEIEVVGEDSWPQLCLDRDNNVIVFGNARSPDFPVTEDAVNSLFDSHSKMFVAKLSNDGRQLLYSSLLGGSRKSEYRESSGDGDGSIGW